MPLRSGRAKLVIHDFSGHPGQAALSRTLSRRGYQVIHQYCPQYLGGKGALEVDRADSERLTFERVSIRIQGPFGRRGTLKRLVEEIRYGAVAARRICSHQPSAVVLSNLPLISHSVVGLVLWVRRVPMIFWHQDLYSDAIGSEARSRLPIVGRLVHRTAEGLERRLAKASAALVPITPSFLAKYSRWKIDLSRAFVTPNWGPLDDIRPSSGSEWRAEQGFAGKRVALYSGTLGVKHDPRLLRDLAIRMRSDPDALVVVVSQGRGREWLEAERSRLKLDNLLLFDYVPYETLADVLNAGDVLLALLEPDAGVYSVPSKVLTYMCAGKPIVAAISSGNLAADSIVKSGGGIVVSPLESDSFIEVTTELLRDEVMRTKMGRSAREFAELTFNVESAANTFERILAKVGRAN